MGRKRGVRSSSIASRQLRCSAKRAGGGVEATPSRTSDRARAANNTRFKTLKRSSFSARQSSTAETKKEPLLTLQELDLDLIANPEDLVADPKVFSQTFEKAIDLDFEEELAERQSDGGSLVGAISLIVGATIGAGILALPQTIASTGYAPSSAVLTCSWMLLLAEALLIAEVNVQIMRERNEYRQGHLRPDSTQTINLADMAGSTVGRWGRNLVGGGFLFNSGTLMVAYIAKSGEIFQQIGGGSCQAGSMVFCAGLGLMLYAGGTKAADHTNRVLTLALLATFGYVTLYGTRFIDPANLSYGDWSQAPDTIAVVFLALVYHDLVPVICSYLGGDLDKIRKAIVLGSVPPLLMFLLWDSVALGMIPIDALAQSGNGEMIIDPLAFLLASGDPSLVLAISVFSVSAIATSAIGTALSLSDYTQSLLDKAVDKLQDRGAGAAAPVPKDTWQWWESGGAKLAALTVTFVPPLAVAVSNPNIFVGAANFAGAYGMTTLFGLMPIMMAWKVRGYRTSATAPVAPTKQQGVLVPGGPVVLGAMFAAIAAIQLKQASQDLGSLHLSLDPHTLMLLTTDWLQQLGSGLAN